MFARLLTALGLISALACAALGAPGHQGSSFSPIIFGGIRPVFAENFLAESGLPSANFTNNLTFSRGTLATVVDATGALTYAGNNTIPYSDTFTNSNWQQTSTTVSTGISDPFGGNTASTLTATASNGQILQDGGGASGNLLNSIWVRRRTGTGVVDLFTPSGGDLGLTLTSQWQQVFAAGSVSNLWYLGIKIVNSGDAIDIYNAVRAAVTYETSPRPQDQVVTGATPYYGPRFDHDASGNPLGLLIEEARTNVVLWNRDLTNAAWTLGATMTSAKNQTGIDGVANSASSITGGAVSATNTILQAITLASSARFQTTYVKRLVGTGTVYMTMDGGTTWVDITSQVGASWASASIPTQTLANPSVGFKLATSGDSIAVDAVQNENGTFATSAILTAGSAVARAADVAQAQGILLAAIRGGAGTLIAQGDSEEAIASGTHGILLGTTSALYRAAFNFANTFSLSHGLTTVNSSWSSAPARAAVAWSASGRSIVLNGGPVATDLFPMQTTGGTYYFGSFNGSSAFYDGHISGLTAYNVRLSNTGLQQKSIVGAPYQ